MKTLIVAIVLIGLSSVAASIIVGSRMFDGTVTEKPYETGLMWDQIQRKSEASGLSGTSISFDIVPKPVITMTERVCRVVIRKGDAPFNGAAVTLSLSMPGMYMGTNKVRLYPKGEGVYEGPCVIIRCPSGHKTWEADVAAERPGEDRIKGCFTFKVER